MSDLEDTPVEALRGTLGLSNAEAVLDLRQASRDQAETSLRELLERSRFGPRRTVAIRLAPPPEGGGETLFQPVGRLLLAARKRGWIERLQTLPAYDGIGFFVALAGKAPSGGPQG